MPFTDPISSSTNCRRFMVSYYWTSTRLHHLVTHSWANWIWFSQFPFLFPIRHLFYGAQVKCIILYFPWFVNPSFPNQFYANPLIRWYKIFFVMLKFVWLHLIIQFFLAQKIHKKGENSSFRNTHWGVQNQYLLMSFYFFCQPYFTNNLTLEKWMVMFSIYTTAIYPQCGTVTYLNS